MEHDAPGGETRRPGHHKLPFRAGVYRQAVLGDPAGHRATPERSGSVGHLVLGHGLDEFPAANPYMLLIENGHGRTESLDDLGQQDTPDGHRGPGGERPAGSYVGHAGTELG